MRCAGVSSPLAALCRSVDTSVSCSLASRPSDVHQFAHDYFAAFIPPARDPAAEDEEDSAAASAAASVDAGEAATPLDSAQQQEQEEEE